MSNFKISPKPLKANPHFMDIHKGKKHKDSGDAPDPFSEFHDYKHKISILFSDLPHSHRFWLASGTPLQNLHELYHALNDMDDSSYSNHVHGHKNDFAKWVSSVYHDDELAQLLIHSKTRQEAMRAIESRIDSIMSLAKNEKDQKNVFKALISKFTKENAKLEKELEQKRNELHQRQKDLEDWEKRNVDNERRLQEKFKMLESQEKGLYDKFTKLQSKEDELKSALMDEKKQLQSQTSEMEKQKKILEQERHQINDVIEKERQQLKKELEEQKSMLDRQRAELEAEQKKISEKQQRAMLVQKKIYAQQNAHIYERLDELMSYATTCINNNNFKEARDAMSKIRYYYSSIPVDDPRRKDFYAKIVAIKQHIDMMLKV